MGLRFWEVFVFLRLNLFQTYCQICSTLEGPFKPVTVPLDQSFRGHAIDLPDAEPEQISISLSSTYDSDCISWITGSYAISLLSIF